jgi:hypothetical protein
MVAVSAEDAALVVPSVIARSNKASRENGVGGDPLDVLG